MTQHFVIRVVILLLLALLALYLLPGGVGLIAAALIVIVGLLGPF